MRMMKIYLVILIGLYLIGCDQSIYKPIEKRPLNFKEVANEYFSDYKFKFSNGLVRDHAILSNAFIRKEDMSKEEFERLNVNITKKWKLVYTSQDQYVYCYNQYNEMTIANPQQNVVYYTKFGGELSFSQKNVGNWVVIFEYREDGTKYCKN